MVQTQRHQCALGVLQLGHSLAQLSHPPAAAGVHGLQYRQDLLADAVAIEAWITVAWVCPDRQFQVLADGGGVVTAEVQQWTHKANVIRCLGIQGALPTQVAQPCQICAPAELQQQRFGSVAGGVSGHDRVAKVGSSVEIELLTGLLELGVTPRTGFGFAAGGAECAGADQQRQLLCLAPAGQIAGNACRPWMPAMVSMPKLQGPVVSRGQIPQQPQQSHRVLTAGNRQQQCCPFGQQLGIL